LVRKKKKTQYTALLLKATSKLNMVVSRPSEAARTTIPALKKEKYIVYSSKH